MHTHAHTYINVHNETQTIFKKKHENNEGNTSRTKECVFYIVLYFGFFFSGFYHENDLTINVKNRSKKL